VPKGFLVARTRLPVAGESSGVKDVFRGISLGIAVDRRSRAIAQ
jgi:hypothetical protein